MIRAFMIYTDNDQESHFVEGTIPENCLSAAESITFRITEPPASFDWHNAPHRQFVITLSGSLRFTMSSGEEFLLLPGDVLLATDVDGKGHKWQMTSVEPWRRAYIVLEKDAKVFFTPKKPHK